MCLLRPVAARNRLQSDSAFFSTSLSLWSLLRKPPKGSRFAGTFATLRPTTKEVSVPKNFVPCDRDQQLLMPPSLNEWLPPDHLVWFIIEAVDQLDLSPFYSRHRDDGWGRAAFDPKMVVTLLLYAYSKGIRSAREIERRLLEDVAFRVIAANERPDHSTICRFMQRHRDSLGELFVAVLRLCVSAGLIDPRVLAIHGTKLEANAAQNRNLTDEELAR